MTPPSWRPGQTAARQARRRDQSTSVTRAPAPSIRQGLRENLGQFSLLVLVNAFVGGMVGLERTVVPLVGSQEFGLVLRTAIFSFIVSFGIVKAFSNLLSGALADRIGRKKVLVAGWILGVPVPFMIMLAPSWGWIVAANVLLGVNQGLAWSMTVLMKIDLVGPRGRGLAVGLNEFAGYLAVGLTALATGYLASVYGLRPEPFYLGVAYVVLGLFICVFLVRDTGEHVGLEMGLHPPEPSPLSFLEVFSRTSFKDRNFFACFGLGVERIGILKAIYPAVWGTLQVATGPLSDRWGRKGLIVAGMWTQATGIFITVATRDFGWWLLGSVLLGLGTAMVYPSLIAAVSDASHPSWRARSLSVYRCWRDLGYAVGALSAGIIADTLGISWAIGSVGALTFISGAVVALAMREPKKVSRA